MVSFALSQTRSQKIIGAKIPGRDGFLFIYNLVWYFQKIYISLVNSLLEKAYN